jgi:hypothetical protein
LGGNGRRQEGRKEGNEVGWERKKNYRKSWLRKSSSTLLSS